jgi:ABC-type nitrate/sulfonate/bicarbonate transport system substrate-binding protein
MRRRAFATSLASGVFAPRIAFAQSRVTTVRLASLVPSLLTWLHHIADQRGFYRDAGLNVELLQVSDSPTIVQAVSTGSADAGLSLGDLVMLAIDKRAPIIMAGTVLDKTSLRLVGGPGIKNVRELAGKRVTAGALKGGTTNLMLYQLKVSGVDLSALQILAIANSRDRIVALQNRQVDGAVMSAPFDILAQQQGMLVLDVYRQPYTQTPLIFNVPWAQRNRKTASAMAQSLKRAAAWINQPANRREASRILAQQTNTTPVIADASYKFIVLEQRAIPRDLSVSENGLRDILRVAQVVTGEPPPPFRLHDYYDPSYLQS